MVIFKNRKKLFGCCQHVKRLKGGATSDSLRCLFFFPPHCATFSSGGACFSFPAHFKESGGSFVSDSLVSRSGPPSPFLCSTTWRVPLGTSWVGHLRDLMECVNEWSAQHNGALLFGGRSARDFGVGRLERKKKKCQSVLNPYEYWWS